MNQLNGVITEDQLNAMRERNEARRVAAIRDMGTLYRLHPANQVQRREPGNEFVLTSAARN